MRCLGSLFIYSVKQHLSVLQHFGFIGFEFIAFLWSWVVWVFSCVLVSLVLSMSLYLLVISGSSCLLGPSLCISSPLNFPCLPLCVSSLCQSVLFPYVFLCQATCSSLRLGVFPVLFWQPLVLCSVCLGLLPLCCYAYSSQLCSSCVYILCLSFVRLSVHLVSCIMFQVLCSYSWVFNVLVFPF